jgi:hypothetical protein
LPTPEAVFDKVLYVLANPVAAHLVDRVANWPGCTSLQHIDGKRTIHARPGAFFRADGTMAETAELRAIVPPCFADRESVASWAARVRAAVSRAEEAAREERLVMRRAIVGRKAILRASALESPTTSEPRRNLRPAVACKDAAQRIAALVRLMEFRIAYRDARLRFAQGERDVEFPAGTYRLRVWGARCAPIPSTA